MDSFNELLHHGLRNIARHMQPCCFMTPAGEKIEIRIQDIQISRPQVPLSVVDVKERKIYPTEARQLHKSYTGMCSVRVGWNVDGIEKACIDVELGEVPIMLKSNACNLGQLKPEEMIKRGEHDSEWGGIFVIKGNEKIIRMLLMSRRNFPIAIKRSTWKNRGSNFSELGIMIRSVREDETSYNNVLHYLNNGTCKFMFSNMKFMAYVPVCLIIKCLVDYTDEEIYMRLIRGYEQDQYYLSCVQQMLRDVHGEGLHTSGQCKDYVGQIFRSRFPELPSWKTNVEVAEFIMDQRILIHLESPKEKFDLIVFMIQKLYQCVQGNAKIENVDSVMMQEVLTSGESEVRLTSTYNDNIRDKFYMVKFNLSIVFVVIYRRQKLH